MKAVQPIRPRSIPFQDAVVRATDIVLASLLVVFLAPILIAVAFTVAITSPGPILFRQERIGRGGKIFACLKFRTMVVDAQARLEKILREDPVARHEWQTDHKLRHDPRVTSIGRFLRKASLDEFPQLFNVLRGEMSLVGPRPIVLSETARYGRRLEAYCSVKPGITGLWQVSGRNDVSYRRRVALDCIYVKNRGGILYFAILLQTLPAVLLSKGSY